MMHSRFSRMFAVTLTAAGLVLWTGCDIAPSSTGSAAGDKDDHDVHSHPVEGPHHGSLIELGDEEYHAEFVHDEEKGTVTIYILDSTAKKSVPVEAKALTVNVSAGGKAKQFELAASPMQGEAGGKSSRFTSSEEALGEAIDQEGAEAKLLVTVNGTKYTGAIGHHDHDEHEHGDGHKH